MCSFSRLPYISKCCCFISNRIGACSIGALQSICGLGIVIYAITSASIHKESTDHHEDNTDHNTSLGIIIVGSVFVLLGVMLLLAVRFKNLLTLRVYMILEIIGLIVGLMVYIIILINLFLAFVIATADTSNIVGEFIKIFAISTALVLVIVIVVAFVLIALKAYFLLCINSYLKELIKLSSGTPLAVGYTAVVETDENVGKV